MSPGGWAGSTRRQRLPRNWPTIRARVLYRDRWTCHVCGQPGADQVDHVVPGDDHSMGNLAAIHDDPCHRAKTAAETPHPKLQPRTRPAERHPGLL